MKNLYFIGIAATFALFVSCKKEDNSPSFNQALVNNWEFVKYSDNKGNEIYPKNFSTDTIPYFSMNLNIHESMGSWDKRWYVDFVGKGPLNFFKGQYRVTTDSIVYENNYDVTHFKRINQEIAAYEKLYIDAFTTVSNYSIRNDSLFINFDHSSKKMVFVQKPVNYDTSSVNLKVKVADNNTWSFPKKKLEAEIRYFDPNNIPDLNDQYYLSIYSRDENAHYSRSIEIGVLMNPVMKGKYPILKNINIQIGESYCRYGFYNHDSRDFGYCSYTSSEVEITDITNFYVKGKFKMSAPDKPVPDYDMFSEIKDGEFLIPITSFDGFVGYNFLDYYNKQ